MVTNLRGTVLSASTAHFWPAGRAIRHRSFRCRSSPARSAASLRLALGSPRMPAGSSTSGRSTSGNRIDGNAACNLRATNSTPSVRNTKYPVDRWWHLNGTRQCIPVGALLIAVGPVKSKKSRSMERRLRLSPWRELVLTPSDSVIVGATAHLRVRSWTQHHRVEVT